MMEYQNDQSEVIRVLRFIVTRLSRIERNLRHLDPEYVRPKVCVACAPFNCTCEKPGEDSDA